MLIYHCTVCLNYELRHQWEVSSIVDQYGEDMPDTILDVAVLKGSRSKFRYPERLANEKNKHVRLQYHPTDPDVFAYRGYVRNQQLERAKAAGADWVWFADCDRVYHPQFFAALQRQLTKHHKCKKLIAQVIRRSTEKTKTDALIAAAKREGPHHANAFFRMSNLPIPDIRRCYFASGGMQVVSRKALDKIGWVYARLDRKRQDQNMFTQGQRAHSDVYFRWRVGGSKMVNLPDSIHMDHNRDKDAGYHLTEQR